MANQFMVQQLKRLMVAGCIYGPLSAASEMPLLNGISQLEWKHRLLIVSDPQSTDRFIDAFDQHQAQIDDRDIVWFVNSAKMLTSNYRGELSDDLANELRAVTRDGERKVVLVGKDGGVKLRADSLDFDRIFTVIDGMPMRIREINSQ
ncbi:MAG TPA: DUF4174 domain-containing protein [Marinagarivorans sp.]